MISTDQLDALADGLDLAEGLLRPQINAAVDAQFLAFAEAVGEDLKPLRDALETISTASDEEIDAIMDTLAAGYPELVAAVLSGGAAEERLFEVVAAEWEDALKG